MQELALHKFHIPVMGLAYTIDSPIKVARFGISSVISIVEDRLVEMMRKTYYPSINKTYFPITTQEADYRAKRITDYLNLVNTIVQGQVDKLRDAAFEAGSEIVKYFEMLPEDSTVKKLYRQMMELDCQAEKEKLQERLRKLIRPGSIDVNIMTKLDLEHPAKDGTIQPDSSEAVAALRGYVKSDLADSSVVFSAGMNPRLYNYLENCPELDMDEAGSFTKKIIIKVSDYRSALIQGKYLAKKGLWVSEFRVESGLNCGGHAFATDGYLLGPILEEFRRNRGELIQSLFDIYNAALERKGKAGLRQAPAMIFSVQGGIGTASEDNLLHEYYGMESTGWGTPFLLVPEATTVDEDTLKKLSAAREDDIALSHHSPLGVRFHYLKGTTSDQERKERILQGKPGSPCTEKHLASNTEFTKEPICTASIKYQQLKIEQLKTMDLPEQELNRQINLVLDKECLCVGLSNSAAINYHQTFVKNLDAVTICPGPNIVNFSKVVSLQAMVNHIYGRTNLLMNTRRSHMFVAELNLYIDYLSEELGNEKQEELTPKKKKFYAGFYQNIKDGINYYKGLALISETEKAQFLKDLEYAEVALDCVNYQYALNLN
ncbi:MAG: hypothetical protein I8H66_03110 [Sphingobacteriia bacterium]|nr:hypothetical protein [Sphingobacteriia bacterium]